jgi:hypothetical protein
MLTYETKFAAFQVKAHEGLRPGKPSVELTGHRFEGKQWIAKGDPTLTTA